MSHNGLSVYQCRNTTTTHLITATFLSHGGSFLNPFLLFWTLKPETWGQSCQVLVLAGPGTGPTVQLHLLQLSVFYIISFDGLILTMLVISVDQNGHNLKNPLASVFIGLGLKMCTMTTGPKLFFNSFLQYRSSLLGFCFAVIMPFISFLS